jgi:hypothetical protein
MPLHISLTSTGLENKVQQRALKDILNIIEYSNPTSTPRQALALLQLPRVAISGFPVRVPSESPRRMTGKTAHQAAKTYGQIPHLQRRHHDTLSC